MNHTSERIKKLAARGLDTEQIARKLGRPRDFERILRITGKRCVLCLCSAVDLAFGFPVCTYHREHGEDDPSCTACNHPKEA